MDDCIFCKISRGEFNTNFLYEDDKFVIFQDINPKAKIHLLLVPKHHYASLQEATKQDILDLSGMLEKFAKISNSLGLEDGYRLQINCGENGGQEVRHLHVHILGGEKLD